MGTTTHTTAAAPTQRHASLVWAFTRASELARSPTAQRAAGAVIITLMAGVALTPLGEATMLPAKVASALLAAAAAVGWLGGYVAARVELRVLCRGMLMCGTLCAIDGISLLAADAAALQRAALAGSLWLSVISGLLCMNVWEELALRQRTAQGDASRRTAATAFWNVVFAAVALAIVISPFFFPNVLASSYAFLLFRLVPIVPGVVIAVTLLEYTRHNGQLESLAEPIAWFSLAAQFSLLLSLAALSLAWSATLLLMLVQIVMAALWLVGYQAAQTKAAAAETAEARQQLAALRAVPATDRLPWMDLLDHDIKHTLTVITLGSSHLKQVLDEEEDAALAHVAHNMAASCSRLDRYINLLLDVARYQDNAPLTLSPKTVRLHAIVRAVVNDETILGTHPVEVTFAPPPEEDGQPLPDGQTVFWDRERIEELLINLIDNARKYSPHGTPIVMHVWALPGGERLVVRVRDQGRGMTPEEQTRAFEPFFRAPGANGPSGRGLGLTMAQIIVRQHGGAITVQSAPGAGTTVSVVLPVAVAARPGEARLEVVNGNAPPAGGE